MIKLLLFRVTIASAVLIWSTWVVIGVIAGIQSRGGTWIGDVFLITAGVAGIFYPTILTTLAWLDSDTEKKHRKQIQQAKNAKRLT